MGNIESTIGLSTVSRWTCVQESQGFGGQCELSVWERRKLVLTLSSAAGIVFLRQGFGTQKESRQILALLRLPAK